MKLIDYLQQEQMSQTDFAEKADVSSGMLSQWLSGHRPIAPIQCTSIEKLTYGKVRREDLRPDDFWLIWPDLKAPKQAA